MAIKMEPKVQQTYLYDFYGELLNEHQRRIFEDFVFNDLSLGEIAGEQGVSRQAVHDLIRRSTKKLEEYEETLHLLSRFLELKDKAAAIRQCALDYEQSHEQHLLDEIKQISGEIIEEL
jgi:predicted DNA-binding protein YlxM (UPF0122 family)